MPPLYHLLDPLWSRLPFPYRPELEVDEPLPGLTRVRMARSYGGWTFLSVYAYLLGDTLVDTGLACFGGAMADLARHKGVRQALITHHHEDHAGNAGALQAAGVAVYGTAETACLVGTPLPVPFYEHLVWGKMRPAELSPLPADRVPLGGREATVVPAPGHCVDQVVFHVPALGWLFSGDAFIHHRVRVFRRDEDFAQTVDTLERLSALDFDVLLCAHRPTLTGGPAALRAKLQWLRDLEGQVRRLHAAGAGQPEIAARLGIAHPRWRWLSAGDASTRNLVRSVLAGPVPRPEVQRALDRRAGPR